MPAATSLATSLAKQLKEQKGAALARLVELSSSDKPFLTAPTDAGFCTAWPADLPLDTEGFTDAFLAMATAVQHIDPRVQKRCNRLVPKKTDEASFWRNYLGHAHAVMNGLEMAEMASPAAAPAAAVPAPSASAESDTAHLTAEEIAAYQQSGLPPPRPPAKRRFAAAEPLQTTGELKAVQMIAFVKAAAEMVVSEETCKRMDAAAEESGMRAATAELMHFQLELMEQHGIDRRFGVANLDQQRLMQRFPNDVALFRGIATFQAACQQATQRAQSRLMQHAPSDPAKRKFKPAARLQSTGKVQAEALTSILAGIEEWIGTAETREALAGAVQRGESAQVVVMRLMREFLEYRGLEQDFGMKAVWGIPAEYKDEKGAVRQAFARFKDVVDRVHTEATIDANKPSVKPKEERRFAPAEGALQSSGELSKEFVLHFCKETTAMLMGAETIALLVAAEPNKEAPMLSVAWQREMLEHLGIEQDYGCHALSRVPQRFGDDQELMRAFKGFQMACMMSLKKAAQVREEALKEAVEQVGKLKVDDGKTTS